MAMLGYMRRLWESAYDIMTIWGKLLFLPSALLIFPMMLVLAAVEIITLDVMWIIIICNEEGFHLGRRWKDYVWYLNH